MINALLACAALFACAIQTNLEPGGKTPITQGEISCHSKVAPKRANANATNPFVRTNTFPNKVVVKDPIGYFIYDMSVYRADFTDVSYLYLCELDVDFTPGSVATKNESGYDWHYDFWAADVGLGLSKSLSQAKVKDFWPKSSKVTVTITSSYSTSYTLGAGLEFSLLGGVKIVVSANGSYTATHSVTTTTEDPSISAQLLSDNPNMAKWNLQSTVQRGLTYNLRCYLLVEMPKNVTGSFSFSSSMDMTCIAWKGYWWEQKKHVTANDSIASN